LSAIRNGLVSSAHDVSDGGLFTTLLEMTTTNGIGVEINIEAQGRLDGLLFGESQTRVVLAVSDVNMAQFKEDVEKSNVPYSILGKSAGESIKINGIDFGTISTLHSIYNNALHRMMK